MMPWWRRLAAYIVPQWRGLGVVGALMLAGVAVDVLKPWPMKLLVDHVFVGDAFPRAVAWIADLPGAATATGQLLWLTLATVLLFVIGTGLGLVQNYVKTGTGNRMAYALGGALFAHLQSLSLRYHGRRPAGDSISRIVSSSTCVRDLVMGVAFPLLTSVTMIVAMFAVMVQLQLTLSLLALAVVPLLALLIRVFAVPMTERAYEEQRLEGQLWALAEGSLSSLPVVQAFGREEHEDRRFGELVQRTIQAHLRTLGSQLRFKVSVGGVTAAGTAALMALGGLSVLQGTLTVGGLLVFITYLASLYAPLETLTYLSSGYASAAANARRVFEVLDAEERVREVAGAGWLPEPVVGHVRLEGVRFGYEAGVPVLDGVDVEARPGEMVALVGATGVGKTTLASLIPRFFDPWEGRVSIDGVDVREVRLESVRAQVALVLQEPFILPLTVAENIGYGRPGASREEIVAAAEAANAAGFVERLPDGYETVVGERGTTLSGGEKQRLSIARALLKDAPILILDEPTSALDAGTEALIMEALERLMRSRTTFVIAHRLSTIRRADRIVVLRDGVVAESGTHAELLRRGGLYQGLHAQQYAAGRPADEGGGTNGQ